MIRELLLIIFIPVSRIFDNEDDIFIFSKNVRSLAPAVKTSYKQNINFKKVKIIWNINYKRMLRKNRLYSI